MLTFWVDVHVHEGIDVGELETRSDGALCIAIVVNPDDEEHPAGISLIGTRDELRTFVAQLAVRVGARLEW